MLTVNFHSFQLLVFLIPFFALWINMNMVSPMYHCKLRLQCIAMSTWLDACIHTLVIHYTHIYVCMYYIGFACILDCMLKGWGWHAYCIEWEWHQLVTPFSAWQNFVEDDNPRKNGGGSWAAVALVGGATIPTRLQSTGFLAFSDAVFHPPPCINFFATETTYYEPIFHA